MASLARSSICQSCKQVSRQTRSFTSSPALAVGPESPKYIPVPSQVQPDTKWRKPLKGTLPVPRDVFADNPRKTKAKFAYQATPEPSAGNALQADEDPTSNMTAWRKQMAQLRRDNLRQGLSQLNTREKAQRKLLSARSSHKQHLQKRLIKEAEAADKLRTTSSVVPEFINLAQLPAVEQNLDRAKARVAKIEHQKAVARSDAVQKLYMSARQFITTEDQLDEAIIENFPDGFNPAWTTDTSEGTSIWNLGPPSSLASLVANADRASMSDSQLALKQQKVTRERLQRIAEEVTSGSTSV